MYISLRSSHGKKRRATASRIFRVRFTGTFNNNESETALRDEAIFGIGRDTELKLVCELVIDGLAPKLLHTLLFPSQTPLSVVSLWTLAIPLEFDNLEGLLK